MDRSVGTRSIAKAPIRCGSGVRSLRAVPPSLQAPASHDKSSDDKQTNRAEPLIDPRELLATPFLQTPFSALLAALFSRMLGLDGINSLYASVAGCPSGVPFCEALLRELNVTLRLSEADARRIPATGPLVAICNHPFGAIEGIVLALLLRRVRPDVKLMGNFLLQRIPQLAGMVIPVDPFGGSAAKLRNLRGIRESVEWLRAGAALGVFPSGEVSQWSPRERRVADPAWNPNIAALIRHTRSSVLPVFFAGANGLGFHLAGLLHPRLRTAQLANELLRIRNSTLEVRIGNLIPSENLASPGDDRGCIAMLRNRVYLLSNRGPDAPGRNAVSAAAVRPFLGFRAVAPVARAIPASVLREELTALPATANLARLGEFDVYFTTVAQSPRLVQEIGRLRELTFREAGEGTGKTRDLDRFDGHYQHLFVWNRERGEVVGAYRLVRIAEVLRERGSQDLYLSSLFRFQPDFFRRLGPAMELGRSFVRREYQRSASPLMLLWRGIGLLAGQHPRCTQLLGPVSISNAYTPCSRRILVDFLSAHCGTQQLAAHVQPIRPFRFRRIIGWDEALSHALLHEIDDVSKLIAELEPDGKGVPVLLRQYLRLGGKILAFNVDPQFSNVLDGLILVDLLQTNPKALARYLGKEGAAVFFPGSADSAGPASRII